MNANTDIKAHGGRSGALAISVLWVSGCSMFLPHPLPSTGPTAGALDTRGCSLERDRGRQISPCEQNAVGEPTLLIIRRSTGSPADPIIHDRDLVGFSSDGSTGQADVGSRTQWQVVLLRKPSPRPSPQPLTDGDLIYLRDAGAHRYLRVSSAGAPTVDARRRSDAAVFALYKADVENPNRPGTCDDRVRDGDYIYLRALEPSLWFTVSDGALRAVRVALPKRESSTVADQRCRTDEGNQLICGWVAHCVHQ